MGMTQDVCPPLCRAEDEERRASGGRRLTGMIEVAGLDQDATR